MNLHKVWMMVIASALALSACKGAQWTSTSTVNGKTTVKGDSESMKQHEAKEAAQAEQLKKIKASPRRAADEPITVALFRPTIADKLAKSVDAKKMFDMLSKAFSSDPLIKLVDQGTVDEAQKQAANAFGSAKGKPQVSADVSVFPHVMAEEKFGINKATKKVGSMMALVLKGEISSHWLPEDQYKVEESGNIFANAKVVNDFAAKSVAIIKTKPHIPNAAFKKEQGDAKKEAIGNALRNLFKKK